MSAQNPRNAWRQRTDGPKPWSDRLRVGAKNKYFVVSCDAHVNEPNDLWSSRVDTKYRDRIPHIKVEADGTQWLISEGWRPALVKVPPNRRDLLPEAESFEDYDVIQVYTEKMEPEDLRRTIAAGTIEGRKRDQEREGVDAEIIFPNRGLMCFATPNPDLASAMCQAFNRWAVEEFRDHRDTMLPMAMIAPGNVATAIKEVQWAAANGFHGLMLPARPIAHSIDQPRNPLDYNNSQVFEPLWSAIEETGLPITVHVSTGQDPRGVTGKGGAITNYTMAVSTTMEPMVQFITSGIFERHRKLKLASIEAGIGWIPWLLYQMDHGYKAHHMWVRPVIPDLPSDYFRQHCYSTFIEEPDALQTMINMGLEDNVLWSNDYPHHEGSFPHTITTIERSLGNLTEDQRVKVLGGNAAKLFNIKPR